MPKRSLSLEQSYLFGFATILFIVASVTVLTKPLFAPDENASQVAEADTTALPEDLEGLTPLDRIQQLAKADGSGASVQQISLERSGDELRYIVKLKDGGTLAYDAWSARSVAYENQLTNQAVLRDVLPDRFEAGVTPAQARTASLLEMPKGVVNRIELEMHEGVVMYQVRFSDGKHVSVDARSGKVVKQPAATEKARAPQPTETPASSPRVNAATEERTSTSVPDNVPAEVARERSIVEQIGDGVRGTWESLSGRLR